MPEGIWGDGAHSKALLDFAGLEADEDLRRRKLKGSVRMSLHSQSSRPRSGSDDFHGAMSRSRCYGKDR